MVKKKFRDTSCFFRVFQNAVHNVSQSKRRQTDIDKTLNIIFLCYKNSIFDWQLQVFFSQKTEKRTDPLNRSLPIPLVNFSLSITPPSAPHRP
jgi:hypothetical protein